MAVIKLRSTKNANRLIDYCDRKATERDGVNCDPEYAKEEMRATREMWHKTDGVQAHHVIQSFSPEDDITAQQANEIGRQLAEQIAPGHEVAVYTHTDREHIHNHLVINAVSFEDGHKYHSDREQLFNIREKSNDLCREHGLEVIREPQARERFSQAEYKLVERGERLWKDELRTAIEDAKQHTHSLEDMKTYLRDRYDIEMKIQNKNVSFLHPEKEKFVRGQTLGDAYSKGALEHEYGRQRASEDGTNSRNPERVLKDSRAIDTDPRFSGSTRDITGEQNRDLGQGSERAHQGINGEVGREQRGEVEAHREHEPNHEGRLQGDSRSREKTYEPFNQTGRGAEQRTERSSGTADRFGERISHLEPEKQNTHQSPALQTRNDNGQQRSGGNHHIPDIAAGTRSLSHAVDDQRPDKRPEQRRRSRRQQSRQEQQQQQRGPDLER